MKTLSHLIIGIGIGGFIATTAFTYKCSDRVTLEKSSDSEWQVSAKQMPDTTITDTIQISGTTVYPTIQYLNVKTK